MGLGAFGNWSQFATGCPPRSATMAVVHVKSPEARADHESAQRTQGRGQRSEFNTLSNTCLFPELLTSFHTVDFDGEYLIGS